MQDDGRFRFGGTAHRPPLWCPECGVILFLPSTLERGT